VSAVWWKTNAVCTNAFSIRVPTEFADLYVFTPARRLVADGSMLTNLNAAALTGGTVPIARLADNSARAGSILCSMDGMSASWSTNVLNLAADNSLSFSGSGTFSNWVAVHSDSWVNLPAALSSNLNYYVASNRVPHVIWHDGNVWRTNRLVP
jgi:hypothetical protein